MSEYEEVVLDSEDEEVAASIGLNNKKAYGMVKTPIIKFQNRNFRSPSPSEQGEKGAANTSVPSFGKSVSGKQLLSALEVQVYYCYSTTYTFCLISISIVDFFV